MGLCKKCAQIPLDNISFLIYNENEIPLEKSRLRTRKVLKVGTPEGDFGF
jgi:hypothetical protein